MRAKSQRKATDLEIVKYEEAALKGLPERRQIRREDWDKIGTSNSGELREADYKDEASSRDAHRSSPNLGRARREIKTQLLGDQAK